jgi:hypothetical protein
VRVIDGEDQGVALRQVSRQPVEAVQRGELPFGGRLGRRAQDRRGQVGSAIEALSSRTPHHRLEELAYHPEGEAALQIGPAGCTDRHTALGSPRSQFR